MSAYNTYAVASSATRNLSFATLVNHQQTCLQAGEVINKKDHRWSVSAAVIKYDELRRKEWARRIENGVLNLNIDADAITIDDECIKKVTMLNPPHDAKAWQKPQDNDDGEKGAGKRRRRGKGNGKGKGAGKAGKPKKWGKGKRPYNDNAAAAKKKILDSQGYKAYNAQKYGKGKEGE